MADRHLSSDQPQWSGFLYDGRTADRQAVSLTLDPAGIRLARQDGAAAVWPIAEIRQTQGSFSATLLRLEYGTDPVQLLITDDPGFAIAMRRAFPGAARVRRHWRPGRLVALALGTIVAVILAYAVGANAVAGWVARRAPPSWERALGADVARRMAPVERQCTDSAAVASLRGVLNRLIAATPATPPTPYDFQLVIVRDSSINAFAAPGGFIAVHSGLIGAAASADEVAGVLAHEAQHVLQRHSTRAIIREVPLQIAISLLLGGSGVEGVAALAGSLGALSYRRDDEAEADREGLRLMQTAGLDGRAMVSFMRTLAAKDARTPRLVTYLSSHPHTTDRIAELERLASSGPAPDRPAMDFASWSHLQRVCGATAASLPSAP